MYWAACQIITRVMIEINDNTSMFQLLCLFGTVGDSTVETQKSAFACITTTARLHYARKTYFKFFLILLASCTLAAPMR